MEELWSPAANFFTGEDALNVLKAIVKLGVGLVLARVLSRGAVRLFAGQATTHQSVLLRRITFYLIAGLFVASALIDVGFDLSVLLGAAGILTVAIGFASQTSASNVISGLFLLGEKPFAIGDIIKVGDITGEVLTVDLLSAKLRTFDNLYVRVPNETLIKSEITTMTRFPIRRADILMGVSYGEDLNVVRDILLGVADQNPLCLEEPQPLFIFQGFGDSALNFQFSVWVKRENFLALRNSIQIEIKQALDQNGIEIPFPHRTLYAGSLTDPFPVKIVETEAAA